MKSTLNVSKKYNEGIINDLDSSKYFMLDNEHTSRTDLFNFAVALGLQDGTPTPLAPPAVSLTRTAYVEPFAYLYKSIYFEKVLSQDVSSIDRITDYDAVLELIEMYANTGFGILAKMKEEFTDSEHFCKKLLSEIAKIQDDYKDRYGVSVVYKE